MSTRFYTPEEAIEIVRVAALDAVDKVTSELDLEEAGPAAIGIMTLLHEAERALREEQI